MLTLRFDGTGCMRKACDLLNLFLLYLLLLPVVAVGTAFAQSSASASPLSIVQYHAGENPAWAGANFDDSTWPVAERGHWPAPPYQSDGFVWVRFRVAVRNDTAEPLAIRVTNPPNVLVADQVFVNGTPVGSLGRVPPHAWVDCLPETAIFDLSRGLAPPGTIASVALRIWYPPLTEGLPALPTLALTSLPSPLAGIPQLWRPRLSLSTSNALYMPNRKPQAPALCCEIFRAWS